MPTNNAIPMGVEEQVVHAALTVQENGGAVSMSAGGGVIKAVSPTVDLDRVAGGVQITVKDVRGSQSETVYDGVKGDKGDKGDPGNFSLDQLLVTDSASGAVASFADGGDDLPLKALTVGITPVQDLHGQEAPYPPGGGKNKCYDSESHLFPRGDGLTIVENANTFTAYAKVPQNTDCVFSCGSVPNRNIAFGFDTVPAVGVVCHSLTLTNLTTTSWKFNSGNYEYVGFYYGSDTNTNIQIEEGSSATSYAPYSNICPISGHTGVNVSRTGINVWDEQWEVGLINASTGQNQDSDAYCRTKNYISIHPNTAYWFKDVTAPIYMRRYGRNKEYLGYGQFGGNGSWTSPSDTYYLRFCWDGTTYNHDISINYPSTDHDYHSGEDNVVIPITWETAAGTVYGGTLDVVNGVLTVDSVLEVFSNVVNDNYIESQLNNYSKLSSSPQVVGDTTRISFSVRADVDQTKYNRISSTYTHKMCNMARHYFAYNDDSVHWYRNTVLYLFLPTALVGTTSQSVFDYLVSIKDTTPLSLWIPLATPTTVTLSGQQIESLLGQNNIWGDDGGDTSVTYYADTKLYIEKRLAELQALILEN